MKLWKEGLLTAAFAAAALGGFASIHEEVTAEAGGKPTALHYSIARNPYIENWQGTPFVYSVDKGKIDMFLDRTIDADKLNNDPWIRVPAEADKVYLKAKLGPITIGKQELSAKNPVVCPPNCN